MESPNRRYNTVGANFVYMRQAINTRFRIKTTMLQMFLCVCVRACVRVCICPTEFWGLECCPLYWGLISPMVTAQCVEETLLVPLNQTIAAKTPWNDKYPTSVLRGKPERREKRKRGKPACIASVIRLTWELCRHTAGEKISVYRLERQGDLYSAVNDNHTLSFSVIDEIDPGKPNSHLIRRPAAWNEFSNLAVNESRTVLW